MVAEKTDKIPFGIRQLQQRAAKVLSGLERTKYDSLALVHSVTVARKQNIVHRLRICILNKAWWG